VKSLMCMMCNILLHMVIKLKSMIHNTRPVLMFSASLTRSAEQ
jgi:hypothetical protein